MGWNPQHLDLVPIKAFFDALGEGSRFIWRLLVVINLATALAFHNQLGDQNQFIHFFKNVAMAGGLLQVVAFGAGRFSLDARRR